MAAVRVLVDTDVLIDYFNLGRYSDLLDDPRSQIYYSAVTRKELLAKEGLTDSERQAIHVALRRLRLVPITRAIAARCALVRQRSQGLEREDPTPAAEERRAAGRSTSPGSA